ncbi:MAG: KamA family radical SAM protein, partial [Actinobacteria bacterium]|nr:KamA family radical SAM protein [Actinomycetota bacterium]
MAGSTVRTRAEWQEQLAGGIRDVRALPGLSDERRQELAEVDAEYPFFTTPYYFGLIEKLDPSDPIYLQQIPDARELQNPAFLEADPLDEETDMPVKHLTHRYPDRVLLVVTHTCAMYCRFCTRKRKVGKNPVPARAEMDAAIAYIAHHTEVRDVLLSGGDPLTLTDAALEYIIRKLRAIPHVEVIRIGSKIPCVNPARVTDALCAMLAKYHPFYLNTHFNHPRELTPEAVAACGRLVDHGIPVGCQTVLLRGVNDDPAVMKELVHKLLKARVKPYYIYQADLVAGTDHFRTSVQTGLKIMESLQGHTTGFGVPQYIIDAPGGGGKIPVTPQRILELTDDRIVLRNYEGN